MLTPADIEAAEERIAPHIYDTPLIESDGLNRRFGARILFKAETLQRTGSFKFRGACNKLALLPSDARARGVIAYSSGNHGLGVAAAARIFGVPAVIVMPADAPQIKQRNVRALGAEVVLYDRRSENREAIAAEIATARGLTIVPPFDDYDIMAGQGTLARSFIRQADARGAAPDLVLCPCGGGELIAGVSTATKSVLPGAEVWAVEPTQFDDTRRSLEQGEILANPPGRHTICDALMSDRPGQLTFSVNRRTLAGALTVTDEEVLAAMREAMLTLKLVVEPGGSVAFAALLAGRIDVRGRTAVVVLSGGNADPALLARALSLPDPHEV